MYIQNVLKARGIVFLQCIYNFLTVNKGVVLKQNGVYLNIRHVVK